MTIVLSNADIDTCVEHGEPGDCNLQTLLPITALAVSFTNSSLSLHASRFGGPSFESIQPNITFPSLSASALATHPNESDFWKEISHRISHLMSRISTRDSLADVSRVLLLGDSADRLGLKEAVRKGMGSRDESLWLKEQPDVVFAAAMVLAAESRREIENRRRMLGVGMGGW
jgi:hypothetical protein